MDKQMRTAVNVYFFLFVGVFLLLVPWSVMWDQAILAVVPGFLNRLLGTGWARGTVSAIGVLDLFVAGREARILWRVYHADTGNGDIR